MHHRSPRLLTLTIALLLLCPTLAAAGGTIEGKVVYNGKAGRNPLIRMGADPNCLEINAGKKVVQEMVSLREGNVIDNVFVHIVEDVAYDGGPPSTPVEIDQNGCIYHPRISGGVTGQTLKIRNSDTTLHNVHTKSDAGNSFNVGQPKAGMEHTHKLRGTEVMLRLKCDVHPWMVGYLGVKSHPFFDVTENGGTFTIENVPAGSYTLQAWQERLGSSDQSIEVKDGETVTVEFTFERPQKSAANRAGSLEMGEFDIRATATDAP